MAEVIRTILAAVISAVLCVTPGVMCAHIPAPERPAYTLWLDGQAVTQFQDFDSARRCADIWAENYNMEVKVTWTATK